MELLWHPKIGSVQNGFKPILIKTVSWPVAFPMWIFFPPLCTEEVNEGRLMIQEWDQWPCEKPHHLLLYFYHLEMDPGRCSCQSCFIQINWKAPSKKMLTAKCCADKMLFFLQESISQSCTTKENTPVASLQGERCVLHWLTCERKDIWSSAMELIICNHSETMLVVMNTAFVHCSQSGLGHLCGNQMLWLNDDAIQTKGVDAGLTASPRSGSYTTANTLLLQQYSSPLNSHLQKR